MITLDDISKETLLELATCCCPRCDRRLMMSRSAQWNYSMWCPDCQHGTAWYATEQEARLSILAKLIEGRIP